MSITTATIADLDITRVDTDEFEARTEIGTFYITRNGNWWVIEAGEEWADEDGVPTAHVGRFPTLITAKGHLVAMITGDRQIRAFEAEIAEWVEPAADSPAVADVDLVEATTSAPVDVEDLAIGDLLDSGADLNFWPLVESPAETSSLFAAPVERPRTPKVSNRDKRTQQAGLFELSGMSLTADDATVNSKGQFGLALI